MIKAFGSIYLFIKKVYTRLLMYMLRPLFHSYGKRVYFDPFGEYTFNTISLGSDVYIGFRASFMATKTTISIGNKVMIGPGVTIRGGDHNTSQIGRFMVDVKEKLPENDQPVVIEDDVWIGANATILKGVRIARGSIIAACSVVTKNVPAYSIAAGLPAKVIKKRWTNEEIIKHEELLYPKEQRLPLNELISQE